MDAATVLTIILPRVRELVVDPSQHVRAAIALQISSLAPTLGKDRFVIRKHSRSQHNRDAASALSPVLEGRISRCAPQHHLEAGGGEFGYRHRLVVAVASTSHRGVGRGQTMARAFGHHRLHSAAGQATRGSILWREIGEFVYELDVGHGFLYPRGSYGESTQIGWSIRPRVDPHHPHPTHHDTHNACELSLPSHRAQCFNGSCLFASIVFTLQLLCSASTPEIARDTLLPLILNLRADPTPNIRFNVAKSLQSVAVFLNDSHLQAIVAAQIKPALLKLVEDQDGDVRYFSEKALAACWSHN